MIFNLSIKEIFILFQLEGENFKSLDGAFDLAVLNGKLADLALEKIAEICFFEGDRG